MKNRFYPSSFSATTYSMMIPGWRICSEIWSDCFCPAKYLGTCNCVRSVRPRCIFRINWYYFSFTPARLIRRTASYLARSYAQLDIWRSVKFSESTVLIIKVLCNKNENSVWYHIYLYIFLYIWNEFLISFR